jgi:aminoglycoside phosphotransferase (APT) family kinase protein
VARLLAALRAIKAPATHPVEWHEQALARSTWQEWLTSSLVDDPHHPNHGWRARLAEHPEAERIYRACEDRLVELREACPERRDLVHSDLLYQNVLLSEAGDRVTGVFSWKLSMYGDFLWDVAWCSIFSPWHPGIGALDLFGRTLAAPDLGSADLVDAEARHAAYMLQIGAHHLCCNENIGEEGHLRDLMARTEQILEMTIGL